MLLRVLEDEVMDGPSEAIDYDSMDHSVVNRSFVDDFMAAGPVDGDVLDLGTGTAQIPIELCRRGEEFHVMAVDLSYSMLEIARYNVEIASCADRVLLDHADGKQLPYEDNRFAAVMSNSIIHHVPEPMRILREALRVAQPGALIFFRDLLRPADETELDCLVTRHAGLENEFQQKMFRDSLHAALTVDELRRLVHQLGYAPGEVCVSSDRHWTWSTRVQT